MDDTIEEMPESSAGEVSSPTDTHYQRQIALHIAVDVSKGRGVTSAADIVKDAGVFLAFLNGDATTA